MRSFCFVFSDWSLRCHGHRCLMNSTELRYKQNFGTFLPFPTLIPENRPDMLDSESDVVSERSSARRSNNKGYVPKTEAGVIMMQQPLYSTFAPVRRGACDDADIYYRCSSSRHRPPPARRTRTDVLQERRERRVQTPGLRSGSTRGRS